MDNLEDFFDEDRLNKLKGPNSFIFTVRVHLKWDAIVDDFFKNVEGWPGLPRKILYSYEHRCVGDLVSGLDYAQNEFTYVHLKDEYSYSEIKKLCSFCGAHGYEMSNNLYNYDSLAFNCPSSKTEFDLESPNHWCNAIYGNASSSPLFNVSIGGEKELGSLDIGLIFQDLMLMDNLLVGASLKLPLRPKALADGNTLLYDEKDNPEHEFHNFRNKYVTVSIQRKSFRGVFTRVEDYDKYGDELLDVKYYEKKEIPENIKMLRGKLTKIYYEKPETPNAFMCDPRTEAGRKVISSALSKGTENHEQFIKNLDGFLKEIKSLNLSNAAIAECFFLEWFVVDLYDAIDLYTISHKGAEKIGKYFIRNAIPFTDSVGKGKEVLVGDESGKFLIKRYDREKMLPSSYERQKFLISTPEGRELVSFNTYYKWSDMLGKGCFGPLKHLGEINTCSDGEWLLPLLRLKFVLEAQIALQEMEASLKGDHVFSRLDKANEERKKS